MTTKIIAACLSLTVTLLSAAKGELITSSSVLVSATAADFNQFSSTTRFTSSPVPIGGPAGSDITVSSTNPDGSVLGPGPYNLGDNGVWDTQIRFVGLDVDLFGNDRYSLIFHFNDGPLTAVGLYLNYAVQAGSGFGDVIMAALGPGDTVLESYDLAQLAPISTADASDQAAFRGIVRTSADIQGLSLSNSAVAVQSFLVSSSVPEPGTLRLIALGALLGIAARIRKIHDGTE